MSETYPFQVPSGSNIIPDVSGNNFIGSSSKPFGSLFANSIFATNISGSLSDNRLNPHNVLVVSQTPGSGQFSSIATAVNSITGNGSSNPYLVQVGVGVFVENTIGLKPYVSIVGLDPSSSIVYSANPATTLFSGNVSSAISNLTMLGTTTSGTYLIDWANGTTDGFMLVENCNIGSTYGIARVAPTNNKVSYLAMFGVKSLPSSDLSRAFDFIGDVTSTGTVSAIHIQNSIFSDQIAPSTFEFAVIRNSGSIFQVDDTIIQNVTAPSGSIGINFYNSAQLRLFNVNIDGFDVGIKNENTGSPSKLVGNGVTILNSVDFDVLLQHPLTSGTIAGSFARQKTSIAGNMIASLYNDPEDFGTISVGDLYLGPSQSALTEVSQLIEESPTLGLLYGGELTGSGSSLNINVASGTGYFERESDNQLFKLAWTGTSLALPASGSNYVYFNDNGILTSAGSRPILDQSILLGRATTNATGITIIYDAPMLMEHTPNTYSAVFKDVFGPLFKSGGLTSSSGLKVSVSAANYYYGENNYITTGTNNITFNNIYHSGSIFANDPNQSTVDNVRYDNGTGLVALSGSYYTRHSLYLNHDNVTNSDHYFLIYGQAQYSGLSLVNAAASPTPPSFISDNITILSDIIVQQGSGIIISTVDERPRPSFVAAAASSVITVHGNLQGLSADDHTQYLLVNGSRSMAGSLNMGGNAITNAGLINSVNITGHASRHLPNGADAITTAAPTTSLNTSSSNLEGIQNSLSRSDHSHAQTMGGPVTIGTVNSSGSSLGFAFADHVHAHGDQTVGTLHALATSSGNGFLSSGNFISFSAKVDRSGDTMTGGLNGTSANFSSITGTNISGTSLVIGTITTLTSTTGPLATYTTINATNFTGNTISGTTSIVGGTINALTSSFSPIVGGQSFTGNTISGTTSIVGGTVNALTSSFSPVVGGQMFTGNTAVFGNITGTTITGTTLNIQTENLSNSLNLSSGASVTNGASGVNNLGTAAAPFNTLFADKVVTIPRAYVFAHDTGTQSVATANTFQAITFSNNRQINDWTHLAGGSLFTGNTTGLYSVDYTVITQETTGANSTFEARALINGIEISGSQTGYINNAHNLPTPISTAFIMGISSGDAFQIQMTASNTNSQITSVGANASVRPSAVLRIMRLF